MSGRYVGIDYGTKKVGVALSDEEGVFAFPYAIVSPREVQKTIEVLKNKEGIIGVVFGIPFATNGAPNELVSTVKTFAKKIEAITPVYFQEEMHSSVEAHRYQTSAGDRDDSAAAIILQRFLDKTKK